MKKNYNIKIDSGNIEVTAEGFIKVDAIIARTGIQQYAESEIIPTGNRNKVINVFRPDSEVFSPESVESFNNLTLTNDHPKEGYIDKKNWKGLSVGIGSVAIRDGDFLKTTIIINDSEAIEAWQNGKKEISCGYSCEDVKIDGVDEKGNKYQYYQKNIRGNHIALVDQGRCGGKCRILDAETITKEEKMSKIKLDGISVEIADDTAANVVQSAIEKRDTELVTLRKQVRDACPQKEYEDMKSKYEDMGNKLKEMKEKMKEKEDSLPELIEKRVQDRANNISIARKVIGDDYKHEGKTCCEIKGDCIAKVHPDMKLDGISDDYRDGLFAGVVTAATAAPLSNAMGDLFTKNDASAATTKTDNGLSDYVKNQLGGAAATGGE